MWFADLYRSYCFNANVFGMKENVFLFLVCDEIYFAENFLQIPCYFVKMHITYSILFESTVLILLIHTYGLNSMAHHLIETLTFSVV